jgi:hypothetical protein
MKPNNVTMVERHNIATMRHIIASMLFDLCLQLVGYVELFRQGQCQADTRCIGVKCDRGRTDEPAGFCSILS